jgi:long-chain acyl-CoA synthetase
MRPEPSGDVLARTQPASRIAARLGRQAEVALAEVDLSLPQYRVLMLLDEGPEVASGLARHLAVTRPTITAVVDGLVSRKLVDRRHDDDTDRRRIGLRLTAAGRDLLDLADQTVDARLRAIAAHLGDARQIDDAMAGLDLWRQALDNLRAARKGIAS